MTRFRLDRLVAHSAMLLMLAGFSCVLQAAPGHEPEWYSRPYAYVLVDQDIRGALTEFGQNLDLIVVFSDKVRGAARGTVRGASAGEFLSRLCDVNQLSWYFDGNVLHIAQSDEVGTRVFDLSGPKLDELQQYLAQLEVSGQPMSSRVSPDHDSLFVSGPPAYLTQIQQHLDRQPVAETAPVVRERGVRVFRGGVVTQVTNDRQ
ncbi:type III secretion protein [Pseudomonas alliivorans]|uniref:type III secretion protein n=1 Tax=Pseudomonas alliivorans TaxID=2810613 RepID=UPI001AEAF306|nr:type III secretion protein [Pseudomonas alliivorans]MBP0949317.1 type III secretion protein [Pseudomonas alliivorans]MEE4308139.1 type III secretion protein [Pseudomonas alliivorans]MEE4344375.1 type III secretion protein [Pseudomonas alliivorans]MEE4633085.1 type III secretion protein [Pseudomonas alliivorans]MEE4651986.1 type III secretion protein [Pseudomonas alliivorans]